MIRKGLVLLFAVTIAVLLVIPAAAAEGTIRVHTDSRDVTLTFLGEVEATGFRLLPRYGGGYLTFDDTLSRELAAWFSGKEDSGIPGQEASGEMRFEGLREGLYLVTGNGFDPFMVSLPWDGYQWDVKVDPLNAAVPQTGDSVSAALFAMAASGAGVMVLRRQRKKC